MNMGMAITIMATARTGIITGVLLAVARISGETAPLLFTVLNNQFWSLDMTRSIANLPVTLKCLGGSASFSGCTDGKVTGTTDASGKVTFTVTSTTANADAEPRDTAGRLRGSASPRPVGRRALHDACRSSRRDRLRCQWSHAHPHG